MTESEASPKAAIADLDSSPFSSRDRQVLVLLTLLGTALRAALQWNRSFVGDEIGTLIHLQKSYWELFTTAETWLSMHYFLILEKAIFHLLGNQEGALLIVPFLAGVACIPLAALLGKIVGSSRVGIIAALLIALNPYLVFQSVNIRAYSLLAALSLSTIWLFLKWSAKPTYTKGWWCALSTFFLILLHPNGVYPVAGLAILSLVLLVGEWRSNDYSSHLPKPLFKRWSTIGLPMIVSVGLAAAAYLHLLGPLREIGEPFHDTPPTEINYLTMVWAQFFAPGFLGWLTAAVFVWGAYACLVSRTPVRLLLALIALAPVLLSAQGVSHFPWGFARYLIFTLPLILVVVASGLSSIASSRSSFSLANLLAIVAVVATWAPALLDRFEDKVEMPWKEVRAHLRATEGTYRVVSLRYLDVHGLGPPVEDLSIVQLSRLKSEGKPEPRRSFLVLLEIEPQCEPVQSFGKIHLVAFTDKDTDLLRAIRRCLYRTVQTSWTTKPDFYPIYDGILSIDRQLGRPYNYKIARFRDRAKDRYRREIWKPTGLRRYSGDSLTKGALTD